VYVVEEWQSTQAAKPLRALTVDPNKGFLITHVVHYAPDGSRGVVLDVDAAPVGAGKSWFPTAAHQVTFFSWTGGAQPPPPHNANSADPAVYVVDVTYKNVKVNMPTGAERWFSAEAFPLPEGALRMNETAKGQESTGRFRGGRFVAIAKEEEQPIFQEAASKPRPMPTTSPATTGPTTAPAAYYPPLLVLPPPPPGQRRLGISLEDLRLRDNADPRIKQFGGSLLVNRVIGGSIAEKMGLRTGDVVKKIDGREVRTVQDAIRLVQTPGLLHIEIVRDGKSLTIDETSDMEDGGL
jgi:hypothetical protein